MVREEGRWRVVVAHVEPTVRNILDHAMGARGFVVEGTDRGEEAIRLVLDGGVSALLVSLELRNVDGWQVVDVLRREGVGIPLIALTADARDSSRREALERGFTDYVTLPIEPFGMMDRLRSMGVGSGGDNDGEEGDGGGEERAGEDEEPPPGHAPLTGVA